MTQQKSPSQAPGNARSPRDPAGYSSRTADKFVLRGPHSLFDAVAELGNTQGRSVNSEIVQAIQAKIAGRQAASLTRQCLCARLGDTKAAFALAGIKPFDAQTGSETKKTVIRFPLGVREAIADAVDRAREAEGDSVTKNGWIVEALIWWVDVQRQTNALLGACIFEENNNALGRAA